MVKGVVFDVGYTLIDETRRWREWREWLGVKEGQLFKSRRSVIAEGVHHIEALNRLQPGFDLELARAAASGKDGATNSWLSICIRMWRRAVLASKQLA
jgi:hypothetical protein